jgi:glyoxylase-like metal-dependent hydrolase (beta-lactamase superfamily II)
VTIPFVRADHLKAGDVDRLSGRIARVIAPNPGPFTYTGTGTYLVSDGGDAVVIDPGPDDADHLKRVVAAAGGTIGQILITHTHRDHSAGAASLKAMTGAEILAFAPHPTSPGDAAPALDEGADHGFRADRHIDDGETLRVGGASITAVHTPGHIANHLCFCLEEESVLFTGDHIMGWATTVVAPPDGDMDDYMESLDLLLRRDDVRYLPTHGAPIEAPLPFVEAVKAHRHARDSAIIEAVSDGSTIMAIVDAVYEGLNPALKVAAGLNVRAHLESAARRGLVTQDREGRYRTL